MAVKKPLTKKERIQEILKCGNDPIYFINNYIKIQHPTKGRIPFKTYNFQDNVVKDIVDHRFNIVLKSRQLGLSTIAAAYSVWYAIFHKDKNILVIATKLSTAINFVKKVKVAVAGVPPWLMLPSFEASKTAVNFSNGSQIVAVPTSDDAGRSEALSLLIIDEAAFIRNFEDIWTGLYPTISTGGRALILSTPNGVGGRGAMYYKIWTDAIAGQNEFNTIELPWTVHPEHDQKWFETEIKNLTPRKVAQEYLCDFISSGDTFLEAGELSWIKEQCRDPIARDDLNKNVWIWVNPQPGREYVISADVARGDAADYSTFHIIDYESCEVVAEFMGKIPPEKLAFLIDKFGRKYNNALAIPENNTFGYFTCTTLRDQYAYPRLWHKNHKGPPMTCLTRTANDILPGFSTQGNTRPLILTKLEEMIRNRAIRIYSKRTYAQLHSLVWNNGKPVAQGKNHDDLVMSLAIGAWICGGAYNISEKASEMARALLNATSKFSRSQEDLPGGIHNVQPLVDPNIKGLNPRNVFKPRSHTEVRHADASDFSWLY